MELDGQNLPLSHGGMSNVSTFQNTLVLSKVISLSKKGEGKGNGTIKHLLCKQVCVQHFHISYRLDIIRPIFQITDLGAQRQQITWPNH